MTPKKLKLDEIVVESYATAPTAAPRGTVYARDEVTALCTLPETCPRTCYVQQTCEPGVCY